MNVGRITSNLASSVSGFQNRQVLQRFERTRDEAIPQVRPPIAQAAQDQYGWVRVTAFFSRMNASLNRLLKRAASGCEICDLKVPRFPSLDALLSAGSV